MRASSTVTVRPFPLQSDRKKPIYEDYDNDVDDELATFSGMPSTAVDLTAIEREVDAQLARLLDASIDPSAVFDDVDRQTTPQDADGETEVESFMSHRPEYKRSVVAKKLQLYEKQLHVREKQLAHLQAKHTRALTTIAKLKEAMETQNKEFEDAQEEWEQEKNTFIRFRGGGTTGFGSGSGGNSGGGTGTALLFQMKMGASAAALAAKRSQTLMKEGETQRQRLQMLDGAVDVQNQLDDDTAFTAVQAASQSRRFYRKLKRLILQRAVYPFANDVRQIDARFGSSVASYFRFFRWIIMSFCVALSIPCIVSLVLHILVLKTMSEASTDVDWTSFVGVAPAFMLYPRYHPTEGMVYTLILLVMQMLLLLFTIRKWIAEDRESKTLEAMDGNDKQPVFGKIVLNAWDFSAATSEQASDLKKSIAETIKVTLREDELAETLRNRTARDRYKLYLRRATAFLIYVVVQLASWYLIILVTTQSTEIQLYIAREANLLAPYVSSIVPAMVTIINGLLPTLISLLTRLEKWDDVGFAIKAMVTRLYLAKVLNVLIQLVSYALLLDPYLLTDSSLSLLDLVVVGGAPIRRNVMLGFKPESYTCRAEQVAAGLLSLVVTDFVVGKVVAITVPGMMWCVKKAAVVYTHAKDQRRRRRAAATVTPVSLSETEEVAAGDYVHAARPPSSTPQKETHSRPASAAAAIATVVPTAPSSLVLLTKSEFQVPQKMVALLYSCTIALVAIPLAPSAALLTLVLHVINFKFDKFFLMHLQKKPTTPWSAKDAGSFFIKFYFCTVSIFLAFTHFFLSNTHLPKHCALQDALLSSFDNGSDPVDGSSRLCLLGSYNTTTERCAVDPMHPKSSYFLRPSSSSPSECVSGYPKCICSAPRACGPFVNVRNGYAPLLSSLLSVRPVAAAYTVVASSAYVAWVFVLAVAMVSFFLRNSLAVHTLMAHARDHEVAITVASLRKKIKQLENRLRIHKLSNSHSAVAPDQVQQLHTSDD